MDYHVHSNHSCDGKSTIFETCQKAIELGIEEIGFSEHMDFEPKDWGFGFFNYERYSSEINSAQEFFEGRLVIRRGIEVDYQYCFEDDVREWLQNKRFDFVIGSVHYLNHEFISRRLVVEKDLGEIYHAYFDGVKQSIESRLFHVVGHFDLVGRYVEDEKFRLKRSDYWENVKMTLEEIAEKGLYLEINSKGLSEPLGDMIPGKEIVNEYVKNGGKLISIGSDAHSIEEVGSGIEEVMDFLANSYGNEVKLLFE